MLCRYVYSYLNRGVFHYVCTEAVRSCTCHERVVEGCYISAYRNIFAINLDVRTQETIKKWKDGTRSLIPGSYSFNIIALRPDNRSYKSLFIPVRRIQDCT